MGNVSVRGMRLLLALAATLALGFVAAGCGGGGEEQGGDGGGGNGGDGGGGNRLSVGYNQEPDILNPYITGGDLAATGDVTAEILESPLKVEPDLSYSPELAEEMPEVVSEDPLTIEYRLREGLTFSDGEELTSEDAKFTYEQIMDEDNDTITRTGWEDIDTFETPDDRTVRITFSEVYAPWMDLLAGSQAPILPQHVYEDANFNEDLNDEIVGSGPYELDEWNRGQRLVLEANGEYWGDAPEIETVSYDFIEDTNSLIAAMQSGEVDFINPPIDVGLIERLEEIEGTQTASQPGTTYEHIAFNTEKVDNVDLRKAIAYGIDRERITQELLQGEVDPLNSVLVPDQEPYFTPAWEEYTYDPERAEELVQQAEADGADTSIEFSTTSGEALRENLQEIAQQQLQEIGIDVTINNSSASTFFGERTPAGDFEMAGFAWITTPDPSFTTLYSGNQLPPDGQNYYRYESEEATEAMEEADATIDEEERAELMQTAQEQMAEDMPLIPMYQRPVTYTYTEGLEGPEVNPTLAGAFWNLGDWEFSE